MSGTDVNEPGAPRRAAGPDGRSTRWDAHRARRREQLIDAALAVLEDVGPDFGLQQVAARAGVTKPVIYRHFEDRAALVEAMADRATTVLMARLMPVVFSDAAVRQRIRGAVEVFLAFVDDSPRIYWLGVRRTPVDGHDVFGVGKEFIADALAAVFADYLRAVDEDALHIVDAWARGTVGFVQNVAEWWLSSRSVERAVLIEQMTTLLWAQIDGLARLRGLTLDADRPITVDDEGRLAQPPE